MRKLLPVWSLECGRGVIFLVFFSPFLQNCQECVPPPSPSPVLIIIGEDLSKSTGLIFPLTIEHLKIICQVVEKNGGGGTVVLAGIGDPTEKGYEDLIIKPLKIIDPKAAVSKQIATKTENDILSAQNQELIQDFLEKSNFILKERHQGSTDLNRFFNKMRVYANQSLYNAHKKILFVNSDGKQDIKRGFVEKVDCDLIPNGVIFYITEAWKAKPDCDPAEMLSAPKAFATNLEFYLKQ